jgi:hypothetical protein
LEYDECKVVLMEFVNPNPLQFVKLHFNPPLFDPPSNSPPFHALGKVENAFFLANTLCGFTKSTMSTL